MRNGLASLGLRLVQRFVVDVSKSMGKIRDVEMPSEPGKPPRTVQMTNLEWALQFVLWKVYEQVRPLRYSISSLIQWY
jgi:hypothetical protein